MRRNKAKICDEPFDGPKSDEEKAEQQLTPDQARILPRLNAEAEAKYKKDYTHLNELLDYNETEWTISPTDKEDRDMMVVQIFAALNNKELSPIYKSGVAIKFVTQYFWKMHMRRREDGTVPSKDEEGLSALKK